MSDTVNIDLGRPEEVVERVKSHLLAQGKVSRLTSESEMCGYRGMDGMKCAIGCLIPDADYDDDIEGLGAIELSPWYTFKMDGYTETETIELLTVLQSIHDEAPVNEWAELYDSAIELAKVYLGDWAYGDDLSW